VRREKENYIPSCNGANFHNYKTCNPSTQLRIFCILPFMMRMISHVRLTGRLVRMFMSFGSLRYAPHTMSSEFDVLKEAHR
jgi:hypothetical protein